MPDTNNQIGRIEILPTSILRDRRALVTEFRALSKYLNFGLGWHYPLDLAWAATELSPIVPGTRVLDAGAGRGLTQWWLSDHQADVISVDRLSRRTTIPQKWRQRFPVKGLRGDEDLEPVEYDVRKVPPKPERPRVRDFIPQRRPWQWHRYPEKLSNAFGQLGKQFESQGTVYIYNNDLTDMPDIEDGSIDVLVSISSLEHNTPEGLRECVVELMRTLKPGGVMVATLGAAKDEDWFHEPSKGWCYTEETLRSTFDLGTDVPSNYNRYDEMMEELKNCAELRDNLAPFYFKSADNGMPWGKWDPQYQSVGVVKVKC